MVWRALLVVAVLLAATAFALWRRRQDGRIRGVAPDGGVEPSAEPAVVGRPSSVARLSSEDLGGDLGTRATLVQFSTAFCQPCRATRRVLGEVAGQLDGVAHLEIDAESHLDLVRRLDIRRTPTVFVLDQQGNIARRASGQPRTADVVAALGEVLT